MIPPWPNTSEYRLPVHSTVTCSGDFININKNNNISINSQSTNTSYDSLTTQLLITQMMTASMLEGRCTDVIEELPVMPTSNLSGPQDTTVIRQGPVLNPPPTEDFPPPVPVSSAGEDINIQIYPIPPIT